jgi:hypothetical protein
MILLEQPVGSTYTPPTVKQRSSEGITTLIILERDGSLHHCPPDSPDGYGGRASVALMADAEQTEPSVIERILDFTFDVLGINNLEMRVYEQQKR